MKTQILISTLLVTELLLAQVPDTLTLDFCQQQARANYPLSRQSELLQSATELKIRNLTSSWLPQLSLNGQSSYQSDVTTIPLKLQGVTIPQLDQDMHRVSLDLTNTLYDGGLTRRQKSLEKAALRVDQQNVEVELYQLRERIDQLYFNALLLQENEKLLDVLHSEIVARIRVVESAVRNGVALQSDADVLSAELIKLEQQLLEIALNRKTSFEMLSEYLGQEVTSATVLTVPELNISPEPAPFLRPEFKLLDLQTQKLDASRALLSTKLMPRMAIFGQLGYGRPGLNMLSNDFSDYYIFGIRLSWTPWNWHQTRNDRQWIDLQKSIVQSQKAALEQKTRILLKKDLAEIEKYETLILKDAEIIALRARITRTFASQLENGTITATDYLAELNAETQARLNKQLHLIQLARAKTNYQFDSGIKE
jgi:outer membrane protein TolC